MLIKSSQIKEKRYWNYTHMMVFMLKHGWMGKPNMGCLYDNLFCFVRNNRPTNKNIFAVAKFIVDHCAEDEDVEHIMEMILKQVVGISFEIKVEEGE